MIDMNELTLFTCQRIIGNRFIRYFQGSDNTFVKYFVLCTCLTSDILFRLAQFDNIYISSYDNYPTIVIRCKNA